METKNDKPETTRTRTDGQQFLKGGYKIYQNSELVGLMRVEDIKAMVNGTAVVVGQREQWATNDDNWAAVFSSGASTEVKFVHDPGLYSTLGTFTAAVKQDLKNADHYMDCTCIKREV